MNIAAESTYMIAVHAVVGRTTNVQPPDTPGTAPAPDPDWFDASDPAKVRYSYDEAVKSYSQCLLHMLKLRAGGVCGFNM